MATINYNVIRNYRIIRYRKQLRPDKAMWLNHADTWFTCRVYVHRSHTLGAYAYIWRGRVCTKSTRVSRNSWMDDNRGGIDDSKVGGFLTADVSLCEGKKSGDIWKPRNRFRVTSQMSIYLVISSRCQTVKKNGGGMSNEFSRILVTRFRERKAYDLFRILPTGGIKSRFLLFTHPRQGCSKQIRYGII